MGICVQCQCEIRGEILYRHKNGDVVCSDDCAKEYLIDLHWKDFTEDAEQDLRSQYDDMMNKDKRAMNG